ncbi:MAG: hypothetical protein CBR30_07570 [Dictyoglomus sp. NZ13-RE01]|nr:MAG: hypothetical protein CBR30_07570 [Dictyoglomus sp. NZ13-RE01]
MSSKVFVLPIEEYDKSLIKEKLNVAIESFNLNFKNKKVLLKPNLLMPAPPNRAITTHPIIIESIVETLIDKGAKELLIGDSPGNNRSTVQGLYEITGMKKVAEKTGARLVNFSTEGVIEFTTKNNVKIPVTKIVKEVDYIINLPKLKTHQLTLMTCAIKNIFGTIPGFNKTKMHTTFPNAKDFSELLVDLFNFVKPALNIVDAIIGMEGDGPSAGEPKKFGKIIVGDDPVAVDTVAGWILGYKPQDVKTTVLAKEKGLGNYEFDKIELIGATWEEIYGRNVKRGKNYYGITLKLPSFPTKLIAPLIEKILKVSPVINDEKCIKCKICMESCPQKAIYLENGKMKINYKECISCFCCHELCPQQAIDLKRLFL